MVPRRALAQSQRTGQGVAAAADHLTLASSAAPDLTTSTHACHATRTRTKPHSAQRQPHACTALGNQLDAVRACGRRWRSSAGASGS
jgi:hypothetical protein